MRHQRNANTVAKMSTQPQHCHILKHRIIFFVNYDFYEPRKGYLIRFENSLQIFFAFPTRERLLGHPYDVEFNKRQGSEGLGKQGANRNSTNKYGASCCVSTDIRPKNKI